MDIIRQWEFLDSAGAQHRFTLFHDTWTGARACLIDFERLKNSEGTSNCLNLMFGSAKIPFCVGDEWGYLEIRKEGPLGFAYRCEFNGVPIKETTSRVVNVELGFQVTIPSHFISPPGAASSRPITWYRLKVKRVRDGACTSVYRRFCEFAALHDLCVAMLKGHHLYSCLPPLPDKHLKAVFGDGGKQFIAERSRELQAYIQTLLQLPHIGALETVHAFLGIVGNLREYSVELTHAGLRFACAADMARIKQCRERIKHEHQGSEVGMSLPLPRIAQLLPGAPHDIHVGDKLLRCAGKPMDGLTAEEVHTFVESAPRPCVIHLLTTILPCEEEPIPQPTPIPPAQQTEPIPVQWLPHLHNDNDTGENGNTVPPAQSENNHKPAPAPPKWLQINRKNSRQRVDSHMFSSTEVETHVNNNGVNFKHNGESYDDNLSENIGVYEDDTTSNPFI